MSRKYMDFVPAKGADKRSVVVSGAPKRSNVATTRVAATRTTSVARPKVVMPEATAIPRTRMVRRDVSRKAVTQRTVVPSGSMTRQRVITTQRVTPIQETATGFAIQDKGRLGEVEDLNPRFVNVDVPKRPLSDGSERKIVSQPPAKNDAKEAKSKRLIGRFRNKSATKTEINDGGKSAVKTKKKAVDKGTFVAPKPTFINQDKVIKRPLSKNIYQKNIVATDESKNKAPVAIIAKPEKESKVGLVVAIILTIILGAVAGTVAFLLLPK